VTQASDLGAIANQVASFYRAAVNTNIQALATQHYGSSEPAIMYPNMVWFDSGTGYVKLRNPTNSAWATVGTIGPPMKWTNVDIPDTSWTTGDVKQTLKTVADSGWVMMNDGTIGDGSSGALTRANPDTQALFTLLWNNVADAFCILYAGGTTTPSGRGASAAADWAAHRHIALPKALGRVFAHAGWGSGLNNYALASYWGEETHALTLNEIPGHAHTFSVPAHAHTVPYLSGGAAGASGGDRTYPLWGGGVASSAAGAYAANSGAAGGGAAHFNIQPTTYVNVMIKL
jgi:microcystin-dependent protein